MQGLNSLLNPSQQMSSSLRHLQINHPNHHHHQQQLFDHHHHQSQSDDFVEQMLSTLPSSSSWPPISGRDSPPPPPLTSSSDDLPPFHNTFGNGGVGGMSSLMMQHEMMLDKSFEIGNGNGDGDDVINGFHGLMDPSHQFQHAQLQQRFGAPAVVLNGAQANGTTVSGGSGAAPAQTRQRVRARRGQATDPHSIAERLRRERIAERMKALQELVPNANKTDKASMLDEIIDYVKFLQLQVKVLSMSRLGGAGAGNPLVADMSSQANGGGMGRSSNGTQTASTSDSMKLTEHHVAKLMEEDMGSAMQYLQGKGLCLMPISLASAISTATCHTRSHLTSTATAINGPTSPNLSALTAQSANVTGEGAVKDGASVSKPL